MCWNVIGTLDLSAFLVGVKAIDGSVGRKTLSPAMKLTIWLDAISTGVGSAREIARRVQTDDAYRWIVGGLEVGHHTLSAFRVGHRARASLCELMNAHLRTHHGVDRLLVRGIAKVTCVVLLATIAPNLLQHASVLQG